MSVLAQAQTKRLLAIHGWSGALLGAFLYLVILTGAVAVFAHEIGRWSTSGSSGHHAFDSALDPALRSLANDVDPEYRDELVVFENSAGSLVAFFHTLSEHPSGRMENIGSRFYLDAASKEVLKRYDGFASDMPRDRGGALADFIATLHITLHLPRPWGLWATGILGFAMLAAVVSGVLLHKHLLKDLFVAPRFSSLLLNRRDRHILAGSWGLPFGFVLAFTGTFFSFVGAIGLPILAMVAFGGDREKLIETVIGVPSVEDDRPAPLVDLDSLLADSRARSGSPPSSLQVTDWGRADAKVTIGHGPSDAGITGTTHIYDGATAEFIGIKPTVGASPSLGNTLVNLMGPLHFGNFGGLLSKSVWFSLGLAMAYVALTGLQLWIQRRADDPNWAFMSRTITCVGYGSAIAMVGASAAFLISLEAGDTAFWTPVGFVASAIACIGLTLRLKDASLLSKSLLRAMGSGLLLLPILRMIFGGAGWFELFALREATVIAGDIILMGAGALTVAGSFGVFKRTPIAAGSAYATPAE